MKKKIRLPLAAALASFALAPLPALAHHAMDGETPETLVQGLLSGLAHPVIGLDHLAFVLAVGWLISHIALSARLGLTTGFIAGAIAGTVVHLAAIDLPVSELLVAITVLAAGLALVWRALAPPTLLWIALPLAGVLHGYAYGESIVGAEAAPLAGYLAGFALVQAAVILGFAALLSHRPSTRWQRPAGALVAVTGLYFAALQLPAIVA